MNTAGVDWLYFLAWAQFDQTGPSVILAHSFDHWQSVCTVIKITSTIARLANVPLEHRVLSKAKKNVVHLHLDLTVNYIIPSGLLLCRSLLSYVLCLYYQLTGEQ